MFNYFYFYEYLGKIKPRMVINKVCSWHFLELDSITVLNYYNPNILPEPRTKTLSDYYWRIPL